MTHVNKNHLPNIFKWATHFWLITPEDEIDLTPIQEEFDITDNQLHMADVLLGKLSERDILELYSDNDLLDAYSDGSPARDVVCSLLTGFAHV